MNQSKKTLTKEDITALMQSAEISVKIASPRFARKTVIIFISLMLVTCAAAYFGLKLMLKN